MNELANRATVVLMALCGIATLSIAFLGVEAAQPSPLQRHWQITSALLGAVLVLAVWRTSLRLPTLVTGTLSKASLIAVLLGMGAPGPFAGLLALEALLALVLGALAWAVAKQHQLESRWDGVPGQRQET